MKALILALTSCLIAVSALPEDCYYAIVESATGKAVHEGGSLSPSARYSPCSTFKVPLALTGYETGVLKDENEPRLPYKGYPAEFDSWKREQTPQSWMRGSCVWYSQQIAPMIGMERLEKTLKEFNYGNADMSGDLGKGNGIARAWLSSSLKISVQEQAAFMRGLASGSLPVSRESMEKTRKILFLEELPNGWLLYGKTGTGLASDGKDGYLDGPLRAGWFAGWAEKGGAFYVIVMHLEGYATKEPPAGPYSKAKCRELLLNSGLLK